MHVCVCSLHKWYKNITKLFTRKIKLITNLFEHNSVVTPNSAFQNSTRYRFYLWWKVCIYERHATFITRMKEILTQLFSHILFVKFARLIAGSTNYNETQQKLRNHIHFYCEKHTRLWKRIHTMDMRNEIKSFTRCRSSPIIFLDI